jgi:hypothetical protein
MLGVRARVIRVRQARRVLNDRRRLAGEAAQRSRDDGERKQLPPKDQRGDQAGAMANLPHNQDHGPFGRRMMSRQPCSLRTCRTLFLACLVGVGCAQEAGAQTASPWRWRLDGQVFAGVNYQHRRFTDFRVVESQNWFMGQGEGPFGIGQIKVQTMISLEPFTLKKIGSPQVFQTGETYERTPLIDYQHPHDLISALSLSYARPFGQWTIATSAAAVGQPALGPPPFMHRRSAAENPQSPLSHHHLDSIHITPGVLSVGLSRSGMGVDGSWFRGREPDERRTDLDFGALDSWSLRGSMTRGAWSGQVSGARVHRPEILEPGDLTRLMASVAHTRSGPISTTVFAAWGQNRKSHGTTDAWIFESDVFWLDRHHLYSRAELVAKEILHTAAHNPIGFADVHPRSRVGAFTLGYSQDLTGGPRGRLGIGGDATMYSVPLHLQESYGGPLSFHLFLRYRFATPAVQGMEGHGH